MTLQHLLQSYEFDELFPTIASMYPNAKRHRKEFETAFNLLTSIHPTMSKKNIRYQIIESDYSKDYYFGAHDSNFKTTWDVIVGKNITKAREVELSDEEIAANCIINSIFIGQHPQEFDDCYRMLVRGK